MNRFIILTLAIVFHLSVAETAAQVNVSVILRPPYSAYLKDYYHLENKAVIVLTNTSRATVEVKLAGSISNVSRGLYIRTNADYLPPMPITIGPGSTVTLMSNPDVMRFFDQQNISTNANDAMLANVIRSGALPEGNYQVCVDAYEYRSGRQLSTRGNGCFSFNISLLDPPVITFPQNNYIYPGDQTNLQFNWTPPLGNLAGSLVEYDQIVVRVEPGQNPNDAITAARDFNANNPVLNKRGQLMQTYITQPYDLPFVKGATYAMQVVARDRNQNVVITNNGRSEIVVFQIGTSTGRPDMVFNEGPNHTFSMVQLKGVLRYYWPHNGPSSSKNNFGQSTTSGGPVVQETPHGQGNTGGNSGSGNTGQWGVYTNDNNTGNNLVKVVHSNGNFSPYRSALLAGVTVQLVQALQILNPVYQGNASQLMPGGLMSPGNSVNFSNGGTLELGVLATATTATDGSFSFNVPNLDQFDFSQRQGSFGQSGGEFSWSISGGYRKVLMVKVCAPAASYYLNPVQFISGIPSDKNIGTFYCRVRSLNTTVQVTDKDAKQMAKEGLEVLLLRKSAPAYFVPRDEVSPGNFSAHEQVNINGVNYTILSKQISDNNGNANFNNMVRHPNCQDEWPYFFYARPRDVSNTPYSINSPVTRFKLTFPSQWNSNCYDPATEEISSGCIVGNCFSLIGDNYSFQGQDNVTHAWRMQFITLAKPRVYALIKNSAAGTGGDLAQNEANAIWKLWRISKQGMEVAKSKFAGRWGWIMDQGQLFGFAAVKAELEKAGYPMHLEKSGLTASDGRIDAKNLPTMGPREAPTGYFYVLQVEKAGFQTIIKPVNLQAEINSVTGDMNPMPYGFAQNLGTLWLHPKGKARLRLINEEGKPVAGEAYYIDPQAGQSGEVESSMFVLDGSGGANSYVTIDLPSGNNRKVVVEPQLSDKYIQDTFTINVPVSGTLEQDLRIKYNLHRIYFNVQNQQGQRLENVKVELMLLNNTVQMRESEESPYIYEGAHSQAPLNPINIPGGNQQPGLVIQEAPNSYLHGVNEDGDNNPYTGRTNNGGGVDFAFVSSGHQFVFRFTAPDGSHYVVTEKTVVSSPSKYWQRVEVRLKKSRTVRGKVRFGEVPVAGAAVRVVGSHPLIEAMTNSQGEYVLTGVPMDTILTFSARKDNSNYVGMSFQEVTGGGITNSQTTTYGIVDYENNLTETTTVTTINFRLRIYDGLDISKLLGFPIGVTSLTETPGSGGSGLGTVKISGVVTISDSLNQVFRMWGTSAADKPLKTIEFTDIFVEADQVLNEVDIPYCRPATLPVRTDVNEQTITLHQVYPARMKDAVNGITLTNHGSGQQTQGVAQARIMIDASAVTDHNFGYLPNTAMYVSAGANAPSMQVPVFTSGGPALVGHQQGLPIMDSSGNPFKYRLQYGPQQFTAIASKTGSRLYADSIILDTRVQTALTNISPANLDLPVGRLRINNQRKLESASNLVSKTIPLGSFRMDWTKVYVNDNGISFDGMITAAGMNMPVSGAKLHPDRFEVRQGSLQANNAKLMGLIPLSVKNGASVSFGYDGVRPVPAWYLAISSESNSLEAASINGELLNGMPAAAKIPFSSLWFYSEGSQEITLTSNLSSYRLHNITDFSLQNVSVEENLLSLNGILEMGIPAIPAFNTGLIYTKQNNNFAALQLRQFHIGPVQVKGVAIDFTSASSQAMSISNGRLSLTGTIKDQSPDVFTPLKYTLTKTNQLTELVVDRGIAQTTVLGGTGNSKIRLSNVEGRMLVTDTGWSRFHFIGDMPDDMGFTADGKRVRFDVFGNLKVQDQSVKLQNVSSAFAGLSMEYDMQRHRLMGSMNFDKKIGTVQVNGAAEIVFDKLGYYFLASGSMEMHNPSVTGTSFMLFGNYDHKQSDRKEAIESLLRQYSYYYHYLGKLPKGYADMTRLDGFFMEAGARIPFPALPNFDIDLGLLEAALEVRVGGNARVAVQFGDANMYGLGMGVYVDARFVMGVSFIHFCGGVELQAAAGIDMNGNYWSNGNYTMEVEGFINLRGLVWAGGGIICDSDCDGFVCDRTEARGSVRLSAIGTVTHNSSSFEIVYGANTFPKK